LRSIGGKGQPKELTLSWRNISWVLKKSRRLAGQDSAEAC
jgi:hypothetical protein